MGIDKQKSGFEKRGISHEKLMREQHAIIQTTSDMPNVSGHSFDMLASSNLHINLLRQEQGCILSFVPLLFFLKLLKQRLA